MMSEPSGTLDLVSLKKNRLAVSHFLSAPVYLAKGEL